MRMKIFKIIVFALLSLAFIGLGVYDGLTNARYKYEKNQVFTINSEDDFHEYLRFYNSYEVCRLESDLSLTRAFTSIGTKTNKFSKVFDGNGYTIKMTLEAKDTPLFNIVDKKGVIKNLEVEIDECTVNTSSYGALAIRNKGMITNCKLTMDDMKIKCDTMAGAMVAINDGDISFCHSKVKISNKIVNSRKESIVSGLCAFNNGNISSVIVNVCYNGFIGTNYSDILEGTLNETIGAIYGVNNSSLNVKDNYYICESDYYLSDSKYTLDIKNANFVFNETTLLNTLHFNNKIWELRIINQNTYNYDISLKDGVSV